MPEQLSFHPEISRKLLHLASSITPLSCLVLDRTLVLWLLAGCLGISLAVEGLRHAGGRTEAFFRATVGFMVRRREWGRVSGATYVLAAQLISIFLFPLPIAIAVLLILSISDTAAALIGMRFGRARFLGKSLAGSLAFFLTALAILWLSFPVARGIVFAGAAFATVVEALPELRWGRFELNDNLMVPLLTGTLLWLGLPALQGPAFLAAGT